MYLNNGALLKNGEYRIEKVLAAGGFGITYLAMQVALGRKVAVKEFFMKEHCNRDSGNSYVSVPSVGSKEQVEHFKEKFLKEARLIASFDHSNIIRIHDVFEENGTAYYVMEYLEGESLSTLVARCGAIDEQVALRYTRQVADALAEVHAGNLLHLDVKPANIMLNKKGEAVLIDFGISKHYDETGSQTSSAAVGISEGYAPLEQYEAGALGSFTPATDIYSLGATLYFLVTGQRPPKAGDVMNDGLPVLPSDISPEVRTAIEAAMQPRRKDRPQSVGDFLSLLESTDNREQSTDNREQITEYREQRKDNRVQRVNAKAVEAESEETRALEKEPEQVAVTNNEPAEPKKNRTVWVVAVLGVLIGCGLFFAFLSSDGNDGSSNGGNDRLASHSEEPATTVVIEDTEDEKPIVPAPPVVNTDSIVAARVQAYQDSIDVANAAREPAVQQAHEDAARLERKEQARGSAMNSNSGSSAGSGTQGSPGGNSVNGIVANVGNRSALSLSRPAYNVQTQGVVVVNVVVRPNGTVESATINARGTNTSDSSLRNAALAAARASKFNAVEGNDNVNGTITYNFKLR
ncbi:MAG: serine/threonine protein kinase [Bacteroidales bacterium]|nr:serine/threonine protein kinase [Bacteroidales bacterium]